MGAAEAAPEDDEVYSAMATIEHVQGKLVESIETLAEAIKFAPNNPNYYLRMGTVQAQTGALKDGGASVKKALEMIDAKDAKHVKELLGNIQAAIAGQGGAEPAAETTDQPAEE